MRRLFLSLIATAAACAQLVNLASSQVYGQEYYDQGLDLNNAGKYREAIPYFDKAIQMDSRNADAWSERAIAWYEVGDNDKAIADASQSLTLKANDEISYHTRGLAWAGRGETDKAIADFNEAIRLDRTQDPAYYHSRGQAWHIKGDDDKAIADYDQAIRIGREYVYEYYVSRGSANQAKGEFAKAIADYRESIRRNPKNDEAYNAIAWLQATCPDDKYRDAKDAFKNASLAYQLEGGKYWGYLDTLAASYAESGAFAQAQDWEAKAIEKAPDDASKKDAQSRLDLYRQNKPYREALKKP